MTLILMSGGWTILESSDPSPHIYVAPVYSWMLCTLRMIFLPVGSYVIGGDGSPYPPSILIHAYANM